MRPESGCLGMAAFCFALALLGPQMFVYQGLHGPVVLMPAFLGSWCAFVFLWASGALAR